MEKPPPKEPPRWRTSRIGYALLIGIFVGVAVYAAAKKGFGWAFLLPIIIAVLLLRGGTRTKHGNDPAGNER